MNKGIQDLRERRNVLAKEARKLLDDNKAEWKAEHTKKFDELEVQITALDGQIARHEKMVQLEAEKAIENLGGGERDVTIRDAAKISEIRQLHSKWLRGGDAALNADDWAKVRNTMSTTTPGEGGYTVQTEVAKQLIEALKSFGGMRAVADIFTTDQGNPMNFPQSDGTAEVGELIGENTTATDADASFATVGLNVYKFSSKVVTVPIELLQDSSIDIEAMVNGRLRTRLGRITNQMFTTGTGSGQPNGAVTASSAGKVGTTGQTLTVIYDDLVDLVHSVDPAYRESGACKFMMNDSSIKVIRKIKDTTGRPIWTPSYEAGIRGSLPQELLGYPIQVNQDVAVMAANAKSILFGDFKYYKIRDALQVTLYRFTDSAYAKKGQVGFLAWMRSGGNLTSVTGTPNAVKHYANSAT